VRASEPGLEGVQQTVDAADELLPLGGQRLLALDVRFLLHLARHQPLRLLGGATHQLLHLAVQLLHLPGLRTQEEGSAVAALLNGHFARRSTHASHLIGQVGALRFEARLQRADLVGEGAVVGLQGLPTAVERPGVAGLLVAIDHLVHVPVQTQPLVDQSQHLLGDGGHLHAHLGCRVLNKEDGRQRGCRIKQNIRPKRGGEHTGETGLP